MSTRNTSVGGLKSNRQRNLQSTQLLERLSVSLLEPLRCQGCYIIRCVVSGMSVVPYMGGVDAPSVLRYIATAS